MYVFQAFPSCRYHYSGKTTRVQNAEEDAALGGGWAKSPTAFAQYQGPRRRLPQHNPVKWVDEWSVEGLSEGHRKKIKAQLLRAHAAFWNSPDAPDADTKAMRFAFDGVAHVLFDAGLLSQELLAKEIPQLVWDSAIVGGWWRLASETRQDMFPEELGHYWVWRDDSRDWTLLFTAEAAEWLAKLLEASAEETTQSDRHEGPNLHLRAEMIPGSSQTDGTALSGKARRSKADTRLAESHASENQSTSARRLFSTIVSLLAARRMEEFLENNNIELTDFAGRVGTTDRTLRAFRKTGRVKRDTLDTIARLMGVTRESLLKP